MVAAVRSGRSLRAVARQFAVGLGTVQLWVRRAEGRSLDQVDWEDRSHAPRRQPGQTPESVERLALDARRALKDSDLGEFGAQAIQDRLRQEPGLGEAQVPSVSTINRILRRHGLFDGRRRVRRKPPPPGWYLPEVAAGRAEIDESDFVEGLFMEGGQELFVLNVISLHGGLCASWLHTNTRADFVRACLVSHWRQFGLPAYAQFDNGAVFAGPRQYTDAVGSVIRMCLSLRVTPVFSVPREFGIQSAIESYNNQWEQKVWHRFHFESQEEAQRCSNRYVAALRRKRGGRQDTAPQRRAFPTDWREPEHLPRQGRVILLRRTGDVGSADVLGRKCPVDEHWCHRLVRCEIDLETDQVRVYGLRRQEPDHQPLLNKWSFRLPDKTHSRRRQTE